MAIAAMIIGLAHLHGVATHLKCKVAQFTVITYQQYVL